MAIVLIGVASSIARPTEARADYGEAISALRGTNGLPADFRRAERLLRACAWQDDDVLCQIALGDLYGSGAFPTLAQTYSRPATDDVEALVWFFIALVNIELHDASDRNGRHFQVFDKRIRNGCKAAWARLQNGDDTTLVEDAIARITYIYRSRGASGWHQLGEIHMGALEDGTEARRRAAHISRQQRVRWPDRRSPYKPATYDGSCIKLFETDYAEARLHFLEATQNGHPFAEDAILVAEERLLAAGAATTQHLGNYGHALLYPPFKLATPKDRIEHLKVPPRYLTDESDTQLEHEPELNRLAAKKPFEKAWLTKVALGDLFPTSGKSRVKAFREQLNFQRTDPTLSPWEIVLALKLASNANESAGTMSANLLGEMYFNGIGVPLDMERARYAFEIAALKDTARAAKAPHSQSALEGLVTKLEDPTCNKACLAPGDIDKNAVRNLCLILADDTRFPNHRVLAQLYLEILKASPENKPWTPMSKAQSIRDCRQKLGP